MKAPICHLALLVVYLVQSAKAACDVASVTTASGTAYNPPSMLCPGDLIFEDNFNTFDESKWMHEVTMAGGGNGKFEYYRNSRTNSFAQDGNLHIKPSYLSEDYSEDFLYSGTLDITAECTNSDNNGCLRTGTSTNILNPIESARIRTLGTFSFKYGTVIARAKLPGGDWLWPAIWLLPTDWKYGSWPVSGEIDLVESRGNRELTDGSGFNFGTQLAFSTLHWGPSPSENQYARTHWERSNGAGYNNDFHTYKIARFELRVLIIYKYTLWLLIYCSIAAANMKLLVATVTLVLLCKVQSLRAECSVPSETVVSGSLKPSNFAELCPGELIFEDQFNFLDFERWQHEITLSGGGNWEFEYYLNNRSNSYTENGNLHIRPTFLADDYGDDYIYSGTLDVNGGAPADACTNPAFYGCSRTGTSDNALNPIKTARIRTVESFSFKYGTVVVRAKMPAGDWLWPAIWLLPRYNAYGTWPSSGEIDLLESRGNKDYVNPNGMNVGTQQVGHTLHWAPSVGANQWAKTHFDKNDPAGYDTDFHIYKLVWNSNGFIFYIDNEEVGVINPPEGGFWEMGEFASTGVENPWVAGTKMAPFDQQFYLIINLAIGGVNYFSDENTNAGGKPWSNESPTASSDFWGARSQWEPSWNRNTDSSHLIVDYVQVYAA
ncbi:hypothetical protein HUJ04_010118 [Dendroctonus ponderosae]|nr:hypothetical protein HUJ04_010118 [Dendroctonus ponderosae]